MGDSYRFHTGVSLDQTEYIVADEQLFATKWSCHSQNPGSIANAESLVGIPIPVRETRAPGTREEGEEGGEGRDGLNKQKERKKKISRPITP